jgi:hypothetical protein
VKIFKNGILFISGDTEDPGHLELLSPDNRHLFVPFRSSYRVYDLQADVSFTDTVGYLYGNHFDQTSKFLLTIGYHGYKLTNLENNEAVSFPSHKGFFLSQAHFGPDHRVWTIEEEGDKQLLQKLDPVTAENARFAIPSPFEFFGIDKNKYQKLLHRDKYCLRTPDSGGMAYSGLLNRWQFVVTAEKNVYRSAVPITDVGHDHSYKVDSCTVDYFYVAADE